GKSDYFGPILAITSKILLGQKPTQKDYENVGLGINLLVSKGLNEGKLKGGLAAAFAEGGFVDPKTLDAISQGGDITNWVAKAFRESTESNTQETLRDIQDNLRLKKSSSEDENLDLEKKPGGSFGGDVEYGPLPLNMTQKQAFATIYELAKKNGDPMPELTAAQAMFESGYLTSPRARLDNNPFGQTGTGTAGQVGRFAKYNSLDDAVKDHIKQWQNNYKGYRGMGTYESPMAGLKANINSYAPKNENNQTAYLKGVASILITMGFDPNNKNPKVNLSSAALIQQRKAGSAGTIAGTGPNNEVASVKPTGANGKLDPSKLTTVQGGYQLRNDAAQAFQSASASAKKTGVSLALSSAYRSYEKQAALYANRANNPYPVAAPGTSNHGYGIAIDVPEGTPGHRWMIANGRQFGWKNLPGDAVHFDFVGGNGPKAYAKGGETLAGPHLAMLGEKGKEIVVDADSSGPARDMLLAINQAKDYKGVMKAIQQYAPYDAMSPQTIVMPLSGSESDYDSEMSGGGVMMMGGDEGDSYDPFDALEMGG
ncbi:MAG: hypothetical protein EB127_09970, partial [Alphaproteobacteria bacterium]|nr:hypothetical protein [Alphaproteobacteria bacterium]